jgi:thioredoxin family protein
MSRPLVLLIVALLPVCAVSQATSHVPFDGIDKWKTALAARDASSLKDLYSVNPAARFIGADRKVVNEIAPETEFWKNLLSSGAGEFAVSTTSEEDRSGLKVMSLAISMKVTTPAGMRSRYVMEQQAWAPEQDGWRIVVAAHSDPVKMPPALHPNPNLYNAKADAKADIAAAVAQAGKSHQRVILVFGGNWCYDCHVLDQAFHQADVAPLIGKYFQVVHVDIGDDGKKNSDLATQYEVPIDKGVPALAILASDGKPLYSQKKGEWESTRTLDPDEVIAFLNHWKP